MRLKRVMDGKNSQLKWRKTCINDGSAKGFHVILLCFGFDCKGRTERASMKLKQTKKNIIKRCLQRYLKNAKDILSYLHKTDGLCVSDFFFNFFFFFLLLFMLLLCFHVVRRFIFARARALHSLLRVR